MITTNANRNADYNYSQKGMLNKITFPTGGYTTFEYEANKNASGQQVGGCRVLRVKTYESSGSIPRVNKYLYTNPTTSFDTIYYQEIGLLGLWRFAILV
jgi:hypothetical protein